MEIDLTEALEELDQKTDKQIEHETAVKWSARACAAFLKASQAEDFSDQLNFFIWGEDLRHEAIEHAALFGDGGSLLNDLQSEIDYYRANALKIINE